MAEETKKKKHICLFLSDGSKVFSLSRKLSASTFECDDEGVTVTGSVTYDSDSDTEDLLHNDGFRHLKKDERLRYSQQLEESEGFDVDVFEPKVIVSLYRISDEHLKRNYKMYEKAAEFAIGQHNVKNEPKLELVKISKVCEDMGTRIYYNITFEAKEMDDNDGDTTKAYQATVWDRFKSYELILFRLEPERRSSTLNEENRETSNLSS